MSGPSFLTEDEIPGSSLDGRGANRLKNSELKFWFKCRGDSCEGLSTKAHLCKRQVLSPQNNNHRCCVLDSQSLYSLSG